MEATAPPSGSRCAIDAPSFSADISTITPESSALGHQSLSAIGTTGVTSEHPSSLFAEGHPSPAPAFQTTVGVGVQRATALTALHEASLGGVAPPPPSAPVLAGEMIATHERPSHYVYRPSFQVHQEDCGSIIRAQCPSELPKALAAGAASLESAINGDVYVQNMINAERFRPVPVQRMRRAFSNVKHVPEPQRARARHIALWNSCSALDPDVALLQTQDRIDVEILELLACSEHCKISAAAAFWTCQALLAGLSVVAGLAALSGGGDAQLRHVLRALEPGFGGLKTILAEFVCAGSVLRLSWFWEKAAVARAESLDDSGAGEGTMHRWFQQAALGALRMVINTLYYFCCLLSTRGNVIVSYVGKGQGGLQWSASFARSLLAAQAILAIMALAIAGSELFELIVPRLSAAHLPGASLEEAQDSKQ